MILQREEIKLHYVGVDISLNMILEFKSKSFSSKFGDNTPNLILSDIDYLPFRDNIFSSILALTSFQNLPHTKEAIKESFRVGKNNAELKFSILRKNLDLNSVLSSFKADIKELIITNNEKGKAKELKEVKIEAAELMLRT